MRAKTPSAYGPQATVIRASGYARIRWSSRPVESTASPTRFEVTNRIRIACRDNRKVARREPMSVASLAWGAH
jgi:hypothetical protein